MKRREKITDERSVDFDYYSNTYKDLLNFSLWPSGEKAGYFDRYKINCLKRWAYSSTQEILILDFGCGIGKLANLMAQAYPRSTVYGHDVSSKSIKNYRGPRA